MKKILLTGSNGFIGKYFYTYYQEKYEIQKFSFLKNDFMLLDLTDVDTVIHLSALVHQMNAANPDEYEKINVLQTLELAIKSKNSGARQFIFMSTIKVYGEETDEIYTENSKCTPEDEYGKSKLKAEIELKKLESEDFKITIIRTPIVYGHGVQANIKNLINLIYKVPVLPFGSILNKRNMVFIANLCHLIDTVIDQKSNGIFLASDDQPLSTTELIELIAQNIGKKMYLIKIPLFESFLKLFKPSFHKRLYKNLQVNNTITKQKLNLKNPYSTKEGIKLMIKGERDD